MTPTDHTASTSAASRRGTPRRSAGVRLISHTAFGRWITGDFFLRHWLIVICVMFMAIAYISSRYMVRDQKQTTRRLEKQLEIVEAEKANERESYMSNTRESSMSALIDTFHLGLSVRERPPFVVTDP